MVLIFVVGILVDADAAIVLSFQVILSSWSLSVCGVYCPWCATESYMWRSVVGVLRMGGLVERGGGLWGCERLSRAFRGTKTVPCRAGVEYGFLASDLFVADVGPPRALTGGVDGVTAGLVSMAGAMVLGMVLGWCKGGVGALCLLQGFRRDLT